jgi:flagellar protein FlbT
MPLRFDLGPFEKLFIGKCVLTNGGDRTMFIVEGETPILRSRDVLTQDHAISAIEKLYRCVQQMYLEEDNQNYQGSYLMLMAQTISERPGYSAELKVIDQLIKGDQHYQALKSLKNLLEQKAFSLRKSEEHFPRVATRQSNRN